MDQETCGRCGNLRADCSDPDTEWYPQMSVDSAQMALAVANWMYDQRHETQQFHDGTFKSWAEKRSSAHPYHYRDGVSIWVSKWDLTPDADWI